MLLIHKPRGCIENYYEVLETESWAVSHTVVEIISSVEVVLDAHASTPLVDHVIHLDVFVVGPGKGGDGRNLLQILREDEMSKLVDNIDFIAGLNGSS